MGERGRRCDERDERDERGHGELHAAEASRAAAGSLAALVPIYEYKCPNGHLFEVIHGMTEEGPTACEVCGEGPLQRVLHPVAVHYKGSGFYSTDYGRRSKQPSKEGSGSSDGASSSSSDSGSGSGGSSDSGSGTSESKKAAEA
jgi:putative FmdB family regulatory protein